MQKENVLITGATGFIGSHVAKELLSDESYRIIATVRKKNNSKIVNELENEGAILVEGDFCDMQFVENLFKEFRIQYVIHIAAIRGGGAGTRDDYYRVNVAGTENLLKASLNNGIKQFNYCSSVGVYGTIPKNMPANIDTELIGDNAYHNSKIAAETKVQNYIRKGLNGYIVRPTITYGKGDDGFPQTLVRLVKNRLLFLPPNDILIHLLDVDSLSCLFINLIKSVHIKQRILIAADKNPISLYQLANLIHFLYEQFFRFARKVLD